MPLFSSIGVIRIIPAYAGSTDLLGADGHEEGDHPRIRGEHERVIAKDPVTARIIPAYAGSTSYLDCSIYFTKDHPRIRGEHQSAMITYLTLSGSSPHTRGALLHRRETVRQAGIIPAYAGSTLR